MMNPASPTAVGKAGCGHCTRQHKPKVGVRAEIAAPRSGKRPHDMLAAMKAMAADHPPHACQPKKNGKRAMLIHGRLCCKNQNRKARP